MDELFEQAEYYDIIPEYNSAGRLCNYHTGEGETVRVMADEWERFNQLAGRQHEVIDGIVTYNPELEPTMPDDDTPPSAEQQIKALKAENQQLNDEVNMLMLALIEEHEQREADKEEFKQELAELKGG